MLEIVQAQAGIPFPNIDPIAIQIGPLAIRWYALSYIAGFLLGYWYVLRMIADEKLWSAGQPRPTKDQIGDYLFWVVLGVILGGRLGYVLFYRPDLIWTNPIEVLQIWEGGMSFHGGLIGVTLAMALYVRAQKLSLFTIADLSAAATPIAICLVRIANFVNGELWGRPTSAPWGVVFPAAGPEPRHPSQLYQSALEGALLFVVAWVLIYRFGALKRPGLVAGAFLTGYGIVRILSEFVREPDRHMPDFPLGLTMGMMLSLPMIAAGLWLVLQARRRTTPA